MYIGKISSKNNKNGGRKMSQVKEEEGIPIVRSENGTSSISVLSIIGQIEGHYAPEPNLKATKYDHMIPTLAALEESEEVRGVLFLINTLGGDVEAGLAMAELIASMKKPTASLVLGGGHSIGVPLAVSADVSFIVPSATMTLHPVRTSGTMLGVPQAFLDLLKVGHAGLKSLSYYRISDTGREKRLASAHRAVQ
jgi:ATP-dependent protease ClpP protease subunit